MPHLYLTSIIYITYISKKKIYTSSHQLIVPLEPALDDIYVYISAVQILHISYMYELCIDGPEASKLGCGWKKEK